MLCFLSLAGSDLTCSRVRSPAPLPAAAVQNSAFPLNGSLDDVDHRMRTNPPQRADQTPRSAGS